MDFFFDKTLHHIFKRGIFLSGNQRFFHYSHNMPSTPLVDLSQAFGRKNRFEILRKLSLKSCRNTELSEDLDTIKEKFPEKIADFGDGIAYILRYYL